MTNRVLLCIMDGWYHTPFILANINFCKDKFAS